MVQTELQCVETSCAYCGAKLEISAVVLPGGEPGPHAYMCPQCGRPDEIMAIGNLHIRVLSPRTDGKTDRYQETMF